MAGLVAFLSNKQIAEQEVSATQATEKTAEERRIDGLIHQHVDELGVPQLPRHHRHRTTH